MPEKYKRNPNTNCMLCGIPLYRRPIGIKHGRVFCSLICYGKANRKETPCVVCGSPILAQYHKITCSRSCANTHRAGIKYKIGRPKDKVHDLRALKLRLFDKRGKKCEWCGYNKQEVLQIHHKDRNRQNNDLTNLVLICPNCHCEEHYLKK